MANRDLWWEARNETHKRSQQNKAQRLLMEALFKLKTISFPGRSVQTYQVPTALVARDDVVWFPDLNKYRAGHDLQIYKDAGCKAIMLRIGGPGSWTDGAWNYTLDPSYYPYLEQVDKIGMIDQSIGYIVHNAFELTTINGATGETIHTELLDEWTSAGRMTKAFCFDHEVYKAYRSTGVEFYVSDPNMAGNLGVNTDNAWKKFRRTVSVYTATWVMKQRGYWPYHETYFTNINKPVELGGVGVQRPLMEAWYPQNTLFGSKTYNNVTEIDADLIDPTPAQISAYLYAGYKANSHQFTDRIKVAGAPQGVDFNVSLEPSATFYYNFGLVAPGTTPPPPPPPDTGDPDLDELTQRVITLESQSTTNTAAIADINTKLDRAKVTYE